MKKQWIKEYTMGGDIGVRSKSAAESLPDMEDGAGRSQKTLSFYLGMKRFIDILLSGTGLIVLSPVMCILAICVRLTSKGPAFFLQTRVGKNGKPFTIFKFRSMVDGADNLEKYLTPELYARYLKDRKLANDPRVTFFGQILRRTSLDELPQLLNILFGDMSLIGPRPLLQDEIVAYGPAYFLYAQLRPGLTGLWQIKSRNVTTLSERSKLDEEYYRRKSFRFDLYIFFKTFKTVFSKKGAC